MTTDEPTLDPLSTSDEEEEEEEEGEGGESIVPPSSPPPSAGSVPILSGGASTCSPAGTSPESRPTLQQLLSPSRLADADGRRAFVRAGGLDRAIEALNNVAPEDDSLLSVPCAALRIIAGIRAYHRRLAKLKVARSLLRIVAARSCPPGRLAAGSAARAVVVSALETVVLVSSADPSIPVSCRIVGAVQALVAALTWASSQSPGDADLARCVASALQVCTTKSDTNCSAVARSGAIPVVVALARSSAATGDLATLAPVLGLLSNMSRNKLCAKQLWASGFVPELFEMIEKLRDDLQLLPQVCIVALMLLNNTPSKWGTPPFAADQARIARLCTMAESFVRADCGRVGNLLLAVTAKASCPAERLSPIAPSVSRQVAIPPVASPEPGAAEDFHLASRKTELFCERFVVPCAIQARVECKCGVHCSCEAKCECGCHVASDPRPPPTTEISVPPLHPQYPDAATVVSRSRNILPLGAPAAAEAAKSPEPLAAPHDASRRTMESLLHDIAVMGSPFKPSLAFDISAPVQQDPTCLRFESRFECGNLHRAIRVGEHEYELATSIDTNSPSHTQWFYFSVSNMEPGVSYRFNIVDMEKSTSEFNCGLRPLMFSQKMFEALGTGWTRQGEQICYYANQYTRDLRGGSNVHYFTLSFAVTFPAAGDTCWFAVSFPYTLSDLKRFVCRTAKANEAKNIVRWSSLCKTLGGNDCDLITITAFNAPAAEIMRRKYVVITARVHPGESQASFIAEGLIDFLLGDSLEARGLRECFVFKIIPMLNPDGVAEGNHRCSLSGADLNRVWTKPSPVKHPTIFAAKWLMTQIALESPLSLFIDLHGHFRKKNIFIYGCAPLSKDEQLSERLFPFLFARHAPCFSFHNSVFKLAKGPKRGSARMVVWKELSVLNSFTMEASFSGMDEGPNAGLHLCPSMLRETGAAIAITLADYVTVTGDLHKMVSAMTELVAACEKH